MKKIMYAIIAGQFLLFATGCNQSGQKDEAHHSEATSADTSLTLNNGSKWTVDSTTAHNYVDLKTMTNMFAVNPFPSLANYQTYGNDMTKGINTMMQECKMKGADHEQLHHWLEPIVRQSNELKNVSDSVLAKKIFDSVHTRVDAFNTYFAEAQ